MKVSIIVPCYNQASYLDEALESVRLQTYQDLECIIVNDGSTDHTEKVGMSWKNKDSRFKYYFKENGGLSQSRNFGIEKASGEFILPLDADDLISSNYIEDCLKVLTKENATLVYGKVELFGKRTGLLNRRTYSHHDLLNDNMIHCSGMYRKEAWKNAGGYDENLVSGLEDWEFWVHMLGPNDKVIRLDSITFYYRTKDNSMITQMDKKKNNEVKAYVFKKHASKYFQFYSELIHENRINKRNLNSLVFIFKRFFKLLLGNRYKL